MKNIRTKRAPSAARPQSVAAAVSGGGARGSSAKAHNEAGGARVKSGVARREAILTAALEEFSARGFEATRLDDVARRASIAKGTIYLYFRDKESLFQELIRTMLTPIVGSIEALGAAELPVNVLAERIVDLFVTEEIGR